MTTPDPRLDTTPRNNHRTAEQAWLLGRMTTTLSFRAGDNLNEGTRLLDGLLIEAQRRLGSNDPVTLSIELRSTEAQGRTRGGNEMAKAFDDLTRRCALALGRMHPTTMGARANSAQWQRKTGAVDRGIATYRQEVMLREKEPGVDTYRMSMARTNLGVALLDRGEPENLVEATKIAQEELEMRTQRYGADDEFTWVALALQVNTLLELAEREPDPVRARTYAAQAEPPAHRLSNMRERRLGRRDTATLRSIRARARALIVLNRSEEAVWLLLRVQAAEKVNQEIDPGRTDYYLAVALSAVGNVSDLARAGQLAASALLKVRARRHDESGEAQLAALLVRHLEAQAR